MVYNHLRGTVGREQFQWVRLESKNHTFGAPSSGFCHGIANEGLMTEMDAVKIPHSDDGLQIRSMKIIDVAENFHISRVPVSPNRCVNIDCFAVNRKQEGASPGRSNYDSSDLSF